MAEYAPFSNTTTFLWQLIALLPNETNPAENPRGSTGYNKPQDEHGPNAAPSFDLSLSESRKFGTLATKLLLPTCGGSEKPHATAPPPHRSSSTQPPERPHRARVMCVRVSKSILQNYEFVTFAGFTPLQLTGELWLNFHDVCGTKRVRMAADRANLSRLEQVVALPFSHPAILPSRHPAIHPFRPSRHCGISISWPKTPLTFAYLLASLISHGMPPVAINGHRFL